MKKILLLMTMVLTVVGAWAQAELDGCYVTFTNVQKNGKEYSLYVNNQKQLVVSEEPASSLGEYSKFICTKVGDKYTFFNEQSGMYMVWRNGKNNTTDGHDGNDGTVATYNSTYCNWTLNSSSNYQGGYYITSKRADGSTNGVLIILNSGAIDAWTSGEAWSDTYSNVFRIDKVGESVVYNVHMNHGTLHKDGTGGEDTWNSKWASSKTEPVQLTLTTGANNIGKSSGNLMLAGGQAGTSEYTLSVPEGYVIKSYRFNFVKSSGTANVTPEGGTAMTASETSQELIVENINARTATFTLSGGNNTIIASNFFVEISKAEPNMAEPNMSFNWSTSTSWVSWEDANDLPSTVLNDNALGYGIKYIEQEMSVAGARTATVTFRYTSGNCALNIRGVEVVNEEGLIVAGDYHVGKAGGAHENNVYTVSVAEGGTYTVRLYATFGADDRANATNGSITVAFAYPAANQFSHDVTFSAEYATLYLGYKAAIPTGVEAYVVTSAANGWAHLEKVEGVIPANTGVILKNVGGSSTYTFAYTADDAVVNGVVAYNILDGTIANRYVCEEAYVLAMVEGEVGFALASLNQLNEGAFLNNANKVYLPTSAVTSAVNALRFNFESGETTAIETVETENANAPIYDLSGRRVLSTVKGGIYIQNGKKFIVK